MTAAEICDTERWKDPCMHTHLPPATELGKGAKKDECLLGRPKPASHNHVSQKQGGKNRDQCCTVTLYEAYEW